MSDLADVVELLQALVRIPSVNPHGDPGTEWTGEAEVASFIGDFLEECGAEVQLREVEPGRPNVIGRFPAGSNGKKRLVLAPHTDTVSVRGMTIEPFAADVIDGKLYGRGASDTKGSAAAMLWALKEMAGKLDSLEREIWFVGLMSEESGQDGSRAFVKEYSADFALIGEPTELQIVNTHKGSLCLTLTTHGRAAHSSTPERGENAIDKMLDVLRVIRSEMADLLAGMPDPVLGAPTISTGTISGGSRINIVPERCVAEVDIRTTPEIYDKGFPELLSKRLLEVCPDLDIAVWEARPLYTDPEHPLIRALERAGGHCVGAPWFCDAAVFSEAGIPSVAAGPGSIRQAHTKDEWIAVDDLKRGVEFYRRFLGYC